MTNEIVPVSDRERIALLIEQVGTMEVTDNASNLTASEVLRDLKGLRERLQKRVTDLRRPLREAADAISEEARPFIEDLLAGRKPERPPKSLGDLTFKRAPRAASGPSLKQGTL